MNARQEWLARRQSGLGGSDIAGVLGISPWRTPLDVYLSKTEPMIQVDDQQSEPAYWGTVLEDVVSREYARRTGANIQRVNQILRRPGDPWAIANIDRAVITPGSRARLASDGRLLGADVLLEAKTASAYKAGEWGRDGDDEAIPIHYASQGMWYLAVSGLPAIDFACLIGGQAFVIKRLERDEETIAALLDRCRAFWVDNVLARVPPDPVNAADVLRLFSKDTGQTVEATEATLIAYNEAVALRAEITEAESALEHHTTAIKIALGGASALTLDGKPLVTWRAAKDSRKVDWQAACQELAARAPDGLEIIDTHTTTTPGSRRFLFAKQ